MPETAVFKNYPTDTFFDECFDARGNPRAHYLEIVRGFEGYPGGEFQRRRALIDLIFRNQGITFTVYGDAEGTERTFPFDPFPRVIPAQEWAHIEAGLIQRVKAINAFLYDLYHDQQILKDGVVPSEIALANPNFRRQVHGVELPHKAYTHVVGCDLVRDEQGRYLVLEDNLRTPSGVSYMLANRGVMARSFPALMAEQGVRPIQHYTSELLACLKSLSPRDVREPTIVLLTPGQYNSAYFEHAFLAQQMGIELVEGRDLFVSDGRVWMRTTRGREQVDVIYRRIDDDFLDPLVFRPDSMLGVPGLIEAYRARRVALANAVGTGVADDKATYAYIPAVIRYYLGEEPILPSVPTYLGRDPEMLEYMLEHPHELVFKEVGGAGGYGMLIGAAADLQETEQYLAKVRAEPHNYIAQPVLKLSRHPTYYPDSGKFEPCHVDLRPYILMAERPVVIPGGLTRVALRRGSLVVNSSQGGGSKDTWVLLDGDEDA